MNEISKDSLDVPQSVAEELYWTSSPADIVDGVIYYEGKENAPEIDHTIDILGSIANDNSIAPLVQIISKSFEEDLMRLRERPRQFVFIANNTIDEHEKQRNQLHSEFPSLTYDKAKNSFLYQIAPDVAVSYGAWEANEGMTHTLYGSFLELANRNGDTFSLSDIPANNPYNLTDEKVQLLNAVHIPNVRKSIDKWLGLELNKISLEAQVQLLEYMTTSDNERLNRLHETMHDTNESLRLKLAENFLAADFGEDFGDALLTVAESEHLADAEKADFLDTLSSCRQSIHGITNLYSGIHNGQFTRQYARAANERLTDAVIAFREIAQTGTAEADLDWAGHPKFDFDSAIEALKYEQKSLEMIDGVLQDLSSGKNGAFAELILPPDHQSAEKNRSIYNLYSPEHGYILLYTRPEGSASFNPALEYGKIRSRYRKSSDNAGVEASISFIANPVSPFALPNPFRTNQIASHDDPEKFNKISAIRLDREGRTSEMAPNDPNRDPINPQGVCSVDLAAIGDPPNSPSGKIARLLSVGGKIRANTNNTESSLNHNTKWFDQEQYGSASGFYKLVTILDSIIIDWCDKRSPDKNDAHSFTYRTKLAMGRQVRRVSSRRSA